MASVMSRRRISTTAAACVVAATAAAPVVAAPRALTDYTPPAGWTLTARYDWRTLAPGLVGADALMAPWIVNDTDNAVSNYERTNVYTVDTPWGTALALRADATGRRDAERFGGKVEIPYDRGVDRRRKHRPWSRKNSRV